MKRGELETKREDALEQSYQNEGYVEDDLEIVESSAVVPITDWNRFEPSSRLSYNTAQKENQHSSEEVMTTIPDAKNKTSKRKGGGKTIDRKKIKTKARVDESFSNHNSVGGDISELLGQRPPFKGKKTVFSSVDIDSNHCSQQLERQKFEVQKTSEKVFEFKL
eukprot:CAMPEP_0184007978 /NCGR_PEP_ID=MMETSP0954-20121128/1673_1 /TAXON_ID=627963 /ORGANISM="Aplanochytrium sp, Strain PBS07" /LENGTH=163 /DNA_ID=CAMNT_0026286947 /DNA_START=206 /DNA_END=697 /DNA_ORIENTATION=+